LDFLFKKRKENGRSERKTKTLIAHGTASLENKKYNLKDWHPINFSGDDPEEDKIGFLAKIKIYSFLT